MTRNGVLSRKALEEMTRTDLQQLCKSHGIRGQGTNQSLVDRLLQAKAKRNPEPTSVPPPTRRNVSTRQSSMIVHEQPEEEDQVEEDTENRPEPEPQTRSRKKAKDTQSRLGVGRPVAVGGAGPRAVTKSLSVSRAKRGKSRTVKPPEDTIPEEAEDEQPPQPEPEAEPEADAQDLPLVAGPSKLPAVESTSSSAIASAVAIALQPLTQQLQETQAEIMQLRKQVADMSASHTLQTATIAALESDIKALKASLPDTSLVAMNTRLALSTSTPRFLSPAPRPSSAAKLKAPLKNDELPNPGIAPTLLGKRSRESTSSNITGIVEADASMTEEELANRIVRPMKKRVKLDNEESDAGETPEDAGASSGPAFAVYSGAEEYVDPPPPTESLPEFYGASSPNASGSGRQPTASQNASENQHPFSYAFLPVAAAPDDAALALPNFPYPEAPTSPSPRWRQHQPVHVAQPNWPHGHVPSVWPARSDATSLADHQRHLARAARRDESAALGTGTTHCIVGVVG
ncbi:hypothetical protein MKEN_00832000 [Mycena kentingensis (nom. inval.)]|nr:hypothetical protein MKEN_00832000 [Mycena kentingensis (nom. inval.)]